MSWTILGSSLNPLALGSWHWYILHFLGYLLSLVLSAQFYSLSWRILLSSPLSLLLLFLCLRALGLLDSSTLATSLLHTSSESNLHSSCPSTSLVHVHTSPGSLDTSPWPARPVAWPPSGIRSNTGLLLLWLIDKMSTMERIGNIFFLSVLDSCFEFLKSLVSCLVLSRVGDGSARE